jgi:hypothetical protein
MNTPMLAVTRCSLLFLVSATYAGSAQWDLNFTSSDWNTPDNWTPTTVPKGPADIATFALSNTTGVSVSANTEVSGIVFTPAATNPYQIIVAPAQRLPSVVRVLRARLELLSGFRAYGVFGVLGIGGHNGPGLTIGPIEGEELTLVGLDANNLTVASNNLSTTFSGIIEDSGYGGSLTKIGTGTLDLMGS